MVIAPIRCHKDLYTHHLWIPMIIYCSSYKDAIKTELVLKLRGDAKISQDGPAGLCICDNLSCAERDYMGVAASNP